MQPIPYLYRAVIVCPAANSELNAKVAQALGASSGDDLSFASIRATRDGTEYEVCDVAIIDRTRQSWIALQANPALLHGAVVQGWTRWDMDPPPLTAEQCAQWLAASTIWLGDAWAITGVPVDDVLQGLGFARVIPPQTDTP